MAASAEAIQKAYEAEINNCNFNVDLGTRIRSRNQFFCESVQIAGTLTVDQTLSVASNATFGAPIAVTEAVIVDGTPFKPALISVLGVTGTILTANGAAFSVLPAPPTPPAERFQNITVDGTAVIANAVWDAGAY